MGILGTGIDIVDVARLERLLGRWPRMAGRLFTEAERSYAARRSRPAEHLAARFAAKEAAFKALGTGWPALGWHDVEVVPTERGPRLALAGAAAALAGDATALVSLSHDGGLAIAQVLLVTSPDPGARPGSRAG
jgi:holo-[acyl-carrier protein] synthase